MSVAVIDCDDRLRDAMGTRRPGAGAGSSRRPWTTAPSARAPGGARPERAYAGSTGTISRVEPAGDSGQAGLRSSWPPENSYGLLQALTPAESRPGVVWVLIRYSRAPSRRPRATSSGSL